MTTFASFFGQALLGWLLADLLSGVFHWWEDRVGDERMPLLGLAIIRPNRLHHVQPLLFTEASTWKRNRAILPLVVVISGLWLLAAGGPNVFWFFTTLGAAFSGEIHRWAHVPIQAPRAVRTLQEMGVFQSPKHHAGHHRPPQDRRYCAVTDWLNPVLDNLHVWSSLETALDRIGLTPNRGASV